MSSITDILIIVLTQYVKQNLSVNGEHFIFALDILYVIFNMMWHLLLLSFICTINTIHGDSIRYPAIFIPGNGGSQIWARLNRTSPPPHFFCARKSNWFELWLDIRLLLPEVIDCFVDNMRLTYNSTTKKTSNLEGVEVQVPGFGHTSTIEFFDSSGIGYSSYFAPIVKSLVALGYTRGVDLRGAP